MDPRDAEALWFTFKCALLVFGAVFATIGAIEVNDDLSIPAWLRISTAIFVVVVWIVVAIAIIADWYGWLDDDE